jgi:hypothetical protein
MKRLKRDLDLLVIYTLRAIVRQLDAIRARNERGE